MKPSKTTIEALADIETVRESGQIRRIGAQMLLALARKEISATDLDSASKMVSAQAIHLKAEAYVARTAMELREKSSNLGGTGKFGRLRIDEGDDDVDGSEK